MTVFNMIKHDGKEDVKEYIYMYNNHFAVQQKLTQSLLIKINQHLKKLLVITKKRCIGGKKGSFTKIIPLICILII